VLVVSRAALMLVLLLAVRFIAGGISLTANDKHSNDKHADNNLTNQSDNNPVLLTFWMLMSLAVPLMLLSAWMLTPAGCRRH
jgi:hypothetical protein